MSDLPAFLSPILEDLASLRSSTSRKLRALHHLDALLATLCLPKPSETKEEMMERTRVLRVFVKLQEGMEGNVVSRLLPLLARLLPVLHTQLVQKESDDVLQTTLTELSAVLNVVQGLSLLHGGSRDLVAKRSSMEVILDLFLLTRHLPSSTQPEPSSLPSSSSPSPTPLASSLLDTLFCALADSPVNTRVFEEAGGLETVMRVLKKHGVRKDVRMKCLEFLIFYLLPEPTAPSSPILLHASLTPPISHSPLPQSPSSSTSQTPTPHQDPIPLPSPIQPVAHLPRTPSRRDPSGLHAPESAPRTPSSSKHRAHGLGISSSFDHLPSTSRATSSHPSPSSRPHAPRRSSSSRSITEAANASDAENLVPQSPSARRPLPSSQSNSALVAPPKQPRTPSRHQAHGLGISHSQPPSPATTPSSTRTNSRSSSLSRPLQPSSTSNASLETFVPQTPTKRRDGADVPLPNHGLPRTPSRYRIKEDEETPPSERRMLGKGRVASLSFEAGGGGSGGGTDSTSSSPTVAKSSSRRESGLMLPPPKPSLSSSSTHQRSASTSSSSSSSSPRKIIAASSTSSRPRSSTPSFHLQPPPPPSPSLSSSSSNHHHHPRSSSPTPTPTSATTSSSSLTPRRPSSSASQQHPSPLLPLTSPALSSTSSTGYHNNNERQPSPNPNPSTPTKHHQPRRPRQSTSSSKAFDLSPSKRLPSSLALGLGGVRGGTGTGTGTTRSVEEKKALLGTLMSNVDSLMAALGAGGGGFGMLSGRGGVVVV